MRGLARERAGGSVFFTISRFRLPKEYQELLKPLINKVYSVQLGVFKNPENFVKSVGKDFEKIHHLKTEAGLTIILIGKYGTYKEAKLIERKIENTGETICKPIEFKVPTLRVPATSSPMD